MNDPRNETDKGRILQWLADRPDELQDSVDFQDGLGIRKTRLDQLLSSLIREGKLARVGKKYEVYNPFHPRYYRTDMKPSWLK